MKNIFKSRTRARDNRNNRDNRDNRNNSEIERNNNENDCIKNGKPNKTYNDFSVLSKRRTRFLALCAVFCVGFITLVAPLYGKSATAKKASAAGAHATVKSLEYFELKNPLSVFKSENKFYILQSDLAVIYRDDVYDTVDLAALGVKNAKSAQKCKNFLLILDEDGALYGLNLSTYSVKKITEGVCSFSVCESMNDGLTVFAVSKQGEQKLTLYRVTDGTNFLYSQLDKEYTPMSGQTEAFALLPDYSFYYAWSGQLLKNTPPNTSKTVDRAAGNVEQALYAGGKLYYKSKNAIYSVSESDVKATEFASTALPGESKGFFVSDGNAYICDYKNDRVIGYDLASKTATGFEISFTKIFLPEGFAVSEAGALNAVTVNDGEELYAIDLKKSLENRYFSYVGYFSQETAREYLVISEINGAYYLIAGDCLALIDKKTHSPHAVKTSAVSKTAFLTSNASVLKYPAHDAFLSSDSAANAAQSFISFYVNEGDKVQVNSTLTFGDYGYSLIVKDGKSGYVPSSFLTESLYSAPEKVSFYTAEIYHKTADFYQDEQLANKKGELAAYAKIMIYGEKNGAYYFKDQNGNEGYVAKSCVQNPSYYTLRTSVILIIAGLSFLATALFLENRYLYSKKKA